MGGLNYADAVFLKICQFLERILMEHLESICSLESRLTLMFTCSLRIRSRKRNIFEKPRQLNSNPYVSFLASSILDKTLSKISKKIAAVNNKICFYLNVLVLCFQ